MEHEMNDTYEHLIYDYVAAVGRRDMAAALSVFAEDLILHVPGRNQISGVHHGRSGLQWFLQKQVELTGGTFRPAMNGILSKDERIIVGFDITATRDGKEFQWKRLLDYRVQDGSIAETRIYEGDQAVADEVFG
jgi:ketosteroid isomerase-like protein